MKNGILKKSLSVFLAILMIVPTLFATGAPGLLSLFDGIAPQAEATTVDVAKLKNEAAIRQIQGLNTDVTVLSFSGDHQVFAEDENYVETAHYDALYHNMLYFDGVVDYNASATSAKTEYGSSWTGSNGITIYWYHPTATLLYDGDTTNYPRLAVAMNTVMYYTGGWSRKTVNRLGYIASGGNGFEFTQNWHGSDGRLNVNYMWHGQSELMGYTSTVVNEGMRQTLSGNSDSHFYANTLKYTASMDDSTYWISAQPTFAFYGDNGDDGKTITATTSDTLYVINYVPLKNALNRAIEIYNAVNTNPGNYTPESVAKFVELANALVAAKPNNFVNANQNDPAGYAAAAEAAVTAWNNWGGLEERTVELVYENLFVFNSWAYSDSSKPNSTLKGTVTTNIQNGTIVFANIAGNGQTNPHDFYSDNSYSNSHYCVELNNTENKDYVLTYTTSGGTGDQVFVFFRDENGNAVSVNGSEHKGAYGNGHSTNSLTFSVTPDVKRITFRFGSTKEGETVTFSNITLFEKTRLEELGMVSWTNADGSPFVFRTPYTYGDILQTPPTPYRTGYTFGGWAVDNNGDGIMNENDRETYVDSFIGVFPMGANYRLFALWGVNHYAIYFDGNGHTNHPETPEGGQVMTYDAYEALTANPYEKTGYRFEGWKLDKDGTKADFTDQEERVWNLCTGAEGDTGITLYAHWVPISYTLTFVNNAGTTVETKAYDYGTAGSDVTLPANTAAHYDGTNHYSYAWPTVADVTADATYTETETKTAHTFGDWTETTKPTCTAAGAKQRTCSACGYIETATVDATGHTPGAAATCTTAQTCTVCTAVLEAAKGHSFGTTTAYKAATCTEEGNNAYKQCTVCNLYFAENAATDSKDGKADTRTFVIAQLAHSYTGAIKSDGNGKDATHSFKCVNGCNEYGAAVKHTWNDGVIDPDSTCITGGTKTYTCTVDGCGATYTEDVAAKGHSFGTTTAYNAATCLAAGNNAYKQCTVCNLYFAENAATDSKDGKADTSTFVIAQLNHSYTGAIKSDGNGKDATHSFKCVNGCNEYGAAVKHAWNDGVIDPDSTCITGGTKTYTCTVDGCGATYTEDVAAKGHSFGTTTAYKAATCTEAGNNAYKQCTVCNLYFAENAETNATDGKADTSSFVIKALGHNYGTLIAEVPATCTQDGTKAHYTCSACNKNFDENKTELDSLVITAKGHTPGADATCTTAQTCTVCTAVLEAAKGHSFGETTAYNAATCLAAGNKAYKQCTVCNLYFAENAATDATDGKSDTTSFVIAQLNHSYTGAIKSDGNGKDATHSFKCVNGCNEYGAAVKHTWNDGVIDPDSTCITGGTKTYTCTVDGCGATYTEDVAAKGHSFGTTTAYKAATCTEDGNDAYKQCSVCNKYFAADADVNSADAKESAADFVREATKHQFDVTVPALDATCTTDGHYAHKICIKCGRYFAENAEDLSVEGKVGNSSFVITASGHSFGDITEANAATCTEDGNDAYKQCSACNKYFAANAETDSTDAKENANAFVLTAPGHTLTKVDAKTPTCTEDGYEAYEFCSECDYTTFKADSAIGHKFGDWTFVADGQHTRVCANDATHTETEDCADVDTDNDCLCDKCGHLVAHNYGAATCDEPATCTVCGATTGDKLGHDWDEPTYTWAENGSSCTATRVCSRDASHTETATAEIKSTVKTPATCTEKGTTTYTATFTEDWATEQSKDVKDIAAINHDWADATYSFAADGSACSATRVCKNDAKHVETATATIASAVKTPATCKVKGTTTYTATFEEIWATEQTLDVQDIAIDSSNHVGGTYTKDEDIVDGTCIAEKTWNEVTYCSDCNAKLGTVAKTGEKDPDNHDLKTTEAKAPTCTEIGWNEYVTCQREGCGYTTYKAIEAKGHDYDLTTGTNNNNGTHTVTCPNCAEGTEGHTDVVDCTYGEGVVTAPTCTKGGYTTHTCTACGYSYDDNATEKLGHTFGDWTAIGNDKHSRTCTVCTDEEGRIETADCSYGEWTETKAPNCTEKGEKSHTCSACKNTVTAEVAALGHDMVTDEAVAPTCTETGLTEGAHCSRCDDATTAQEVVKALGHSFTNYISNDDATCTADGTKTAKCDRCEVTDTLADADSALGHSFTNYVSNNDATCTADGTKTAKCDRCEEKNTVADVNSALGHAEVAHEAKAPTCTAIGWDAYVTCSRCDYTTYNELTMIEHSWADADCTNPSTCTACGKESGTAIGHSYTVFVLTVPKTCYADGYTTYKCVRCDAIENRDIVSASHTIATVAAKAPTCKDIGWDAYEYCTVCNDYTTYVEKAALGHDIVTDTAVAATCTEPGKTEGSHCSRCNDATIAQEVIPATGHDMQKTADEVAPKCEVPGKTAVYTCANGCGKTEGGEEIAALEHDMQLTADEVAPKCEVPGKTAVYTCANGCGKTTGGEEIAALVHDMQKTADEVAPECEVPGKTAVYTCANGCGKTEGGDEIAALEHDMQKTADEVAPKCEVPGKTAVYTCANGCGKTEGGEEIAALEHDMQKTADEVAPKCEVPGKTAVYTCANGCGKTTGGEEIAALVHDMQKTADEVAPKCEVPGKTAVYTCANGCGKTTGGEEIAALVHDMQKTADEVAPECEVPGKTAVYTCANGCGKTEGGEVISATGHDYDAVVTEPTCTADGYTTYTCSACGDTYVSDEVAALGHTAAEAVKENEVKATCEADGSYDMVVRCAVCKTILSTESFTVDALGHNYQLEDIVRPSKQADGTWGSGYETYVCQNDSKHAYTVVVARADYSDYDDAVADLEERLEDATLSDEVRAEIEDLLENNKVEPDRIASEQNEVDTAADAIANGSTDYMKTFKVTFVVDGEIFDEQTVFYGSSAKAPAAPVKEGFVFTGWDGKYTNIKADTIVTATYREGDVVVDVNKADVKLAIGETKQIAVSILPEDAQVDLTWTSADPSIATVDENGVVTGVKVGITTVTVTAFNGEIKENVSVYVYNSNTSHTVQLTKSSYGYFVVNGYSFYDTAFINVNAGQEFKFQFALNSQYNAEDMVILVNGQELSLGEDNYFTIPCMTDNLMILVIHAPGGSTNGDNDSNNGNNGSNTTAHSCWCHSSNRLFRFLWKILMIFCKLFGIESYHYCACGDAHW